MPSGTNNPLRQVVCSPSFGETDFLVVVGAKGLVLIGAWQWLVGTITPAAVATLKVKRHQHSDDHEDEYHDEEVGEDGLHEVRCHDDAVGLLKSLCQGCGLLIGGSNGLAQLAVTTILVSEYSVTDQQNSHGAKTVFFFIYVCIHLFEPELVMPTRLQQRSASQQNCN